MTLTATPIPPVSTGQLAQVETTNGTTATIIPLSETNDVSSSFKLVNIPQNQQQITKFPVWEIPQKQTAKPVSEFI